MRCTAAIEGAVPATTYTDNIHSMHIIRQMVKHITKYEVRSTEHGVIVVVLLDVDVRMTYQLLMGCGHSLTRRTSAVHSSDRRSSASHHLHR